MADTFTESKIKKTWMLKMLNYVNIFVVSLALRMHPFDLMAK